MRGVNINDLPNHYQQQARAQLAARLAPADLEQGAGNVAAGKDAGQGGGTQAGIPGPVRLRIHSKRRRLVDADGLCAKWVIDALVTAGILHDDDPAHVREVAFSQEKSEQEETVVEVWKDE